MKTVTVKHATGSSRDFASLALALKQLKKVYGPQIVTGGNLAEGRVLVWRSEEVARNDSGLLALAMITQVQSDV